MDRLKEDLMACSGGSKFKVISTIIFNSNFKAIKNYRIANYLYKKLHFRLLPKWLHYRNRIKYAIDIDYRAEISGGFKIVHGIGVVIGKDVVAGKNFTVYQGVTCGGNMGKEKIVNGKIISQPYISDNVTMYAHSSAFGPVCIGENSAIGAGAVVLKDVPERSVFYCKQETSYKSI